MTDLELGQTLVLIKPDALKNSLTGYVLSQLSEYHTGLRFAGAKIVQVSRMLAAEHYAEHQAKPFFPSLLNYIMGCIHYPDEPQRRRVVAFVYQGKNATTLARNMAGPTNPHVARIKKPGCIRALGTTVPIQDDTGKMVGERMENLIHTSANPKDAEREIKLWFEPSDIPPSMHAYPTEVCDAHYYLTEQKFSLTYTPGSLCIIAPGEVVWRSDLESVHALLHDQPASTTFFSIIAKYLINKKYETS